MGWQGRWRMISAGKGRSKRSEGRDRQRIPNVLENDRAPEDLETMLRILVQALI